MSFKLRLRLETAKRLQKLNAKRKSVRQKKKEAKANAKEADPEKHKDIVRVPRIKKNKLVTPPQATSKFKRRQINKTWLPTHLWHTKRAHLTRPTLPLWRMAIPLRPTEKSYRPTHRAAGTRGCIAWDTSYTSTIGCRGTESALESVLKALGFEGEGWTGPKYRRWKNGTRHSESWVFIKAEREKPIAPATVLWQVESEAQKVVSGIVQPKAHTGGDPAMSARTKSKLTTLNRKLLIRVHPSAFHQLWTELLGAAKMQRPQVLIEDLRFEIGSIVVQGPQSTEALAGVLKPAGDQSDVAGLWSTISGISNPAVLPLNTFLAMKVSDPRLSHPPKSVPVRRDDQTLNKMNEVIVSWPLDKLLSPSTLFDHKTRYSVVKSLPSQKAINRRRASLLPGQQMDSKEDDAQIPAILLTQRSPDRRSNTQGLWTVLLPWACVDLVWRSLVYYPLSTGSTPRFGGLEQIQQVAFEQCVPWFPGDFPGTDPGKAWDRTESENRFDTWLRRPPSKRLAWDTVDLGVGRKGELGRGWACDWEYLFQSTAPLARDNRSTKASAIPPNTPKSTQPRLLTQRQRKAAAAAIQDAKKTETEACRRNSSSPETECEYEEIHNDVKFEQLTPSKALALTNAYRSCQLPVEPSLATIRLKLLTRGTPSPAARIYRLPSVLGSNMEGGSKSTTVPQQDPEHIDSNFRPVLFPSSSSSNIDAASLRKQWLDLDPNPLGQQANPKSSTALPVNRGAEKTNRYQDPVSNTVYDPKHAGDMSRIRVFPPRETKPEVLNMFGPRPPPRTEEEILKILQPQLAPKMTINSDGDLVPENLWDKHVPCPEPEDLIGFVTSGGYNLIEGRGTAIGALWVQRLIDGWKAEDKLALNGNEPDGTETGNGKVDIVQRTQQKTDSKATTRITKDQAGAKPQKQLAQRVDRERHLCIVRNAGESIGRLAIWELC